MCFVGHGAFGVITKPAWVPYFGVVGIEPRTAFQLMPVIGAWDILMGVLVLITPRPAIALWMVGWAIWTALLRPLSGESFWEALERGGNYGVPLALLLLMTPPASWRGYFAPAVFVALKAKERHLRVAMTATIVLLLVGHGALSIGMKPQFLRNLQSVMGDRAAVLLPILGWLELVLAGGVALRASWPLLVFVAVWKILTEALFVTAGAPVWEWVERGGSYAAPIALAMLLAKVAANQPMAEGLRIAPGDH